MPYARTDYGLDEIKRALSNPVSAPCGPHAHSRIHAVEGELANHPLFQRARVTAKIVTGGASDANASYHTKKSDGTWTHNAKTRKAHPLPRPEVGKHSTLGALETAQALLRALNSNLIQPYLGRLDNGQPMKVNVNFAIPIGMGYVHTTQGGSTRVPMMMLFVYCKPNPGNTDIPIFQTVVPSDAHEFGGSDPNILIA